MLPGAAETKVRPAVVISSDTYLVERPDCVGRHPDNEAAPEGCVNGLSSPGLAAGRAPRHVVLPSLRADDSSLGIDGDRPPERARLDPGPGLRPRRLCDLSLRTKRRFRRLIVASALSFPIKMADLARLHHNSQATARPNSPSCRVPSASVRDRKSVVWGKR